MEQPPEQCYNFKIKTPNAIAIIGSSNTGKSTILKRIFEQWHYVMSEDSLPIGKICLLYKYPQELYDDIIKSVENHFPNAEIEAHQGFPVSRLEESDFFSAPSGTQNVIICDDNYSACNCPLFAEWLTGKLHHTNSTLFFIAQDSSSLPKFIKEGLRSCQYFIITRASQSGVLLSDLNRKTHMYQPRFLYYAYQWILANNQGPNWPYMVLDLSNQATESSCVRTGIFKDDVGVILRPA